MKKFFAALFLAAISLGLPQFLLAEEDEPGTCEVPADIGEYYCTCVTEVLDITRDQSSADVPTCLATCQETEGSSSWTLSWCGTDLTTTPINQGTVEPMSVVETAKKDAIIPLLNVDIPGFDGFQTPTESATDKSVSSNFIGVYINAVYGWLLGAAALVAIVLIMVGGLQYATARGDSGKITKAKERISKAVVGIILLLLAYNIAFLIDPGTTRLQSLTLANIEGIESFPPEGEDSNVIPNLAYSTELVDGNGDHIIFATADPTMDSAVLTALQEAANKFAAKSGDKSIVITSARRDLQKQATLFYNNCLTKGGVCKPDTCNPASSSVVTKQNGKFILTGTLAGVTNAATIISGIVANANPLSCPHTSSVAIDAWCNDGGSNFQHDPACQTLLIQTMIESGFCRLTSEVWHFELVTKQVSSACSTGNNDASYTTKSGSYAPTADCSKWDFKRNLCVLKKAK